MLSTYAVGYSVVKKNHIHNTHTLKMLATLSCHTGLRSQPSASQKPGFIILETNYRLFAYTGKPSFSCHNQTPLAAGEVCASR